MLLFLLLGPLAAPITTTPANLANHADPNAKTPAVPCAWWSLGVCLVLSKVAPDWTSLDRLTLFGSWLVLSMVP